MPFVPSRRLLVLFAALVPGAVLAAFVGPGGVALVAGLGVLTLLLALLGEQLLRPEPDAVRLERVLPRRLEVGVPAEITLRLISRSARPWVVRVADGCPEALRPGDAPLEVPLQPGESVEARYPVTPSARGAFGFEPALLRLRRPRGLVEHLRTGDVPSRARVLPDLRGLARHRLRARRDLLHLGGARRTRVLGRDGDFDRLREFVSGDDVRHVDWKATARLRRPITRVWQAEKAQNLVILVDGTRLMATRAGDLSKLDHAVASALTLSWAGLAAGDRVAVGVFDDGLRRWLPPDDGLARFGRILDTLYDAEAVSRFPRYREVARRLLRVLGRRSLIVWVTDLLDADQGEELMAALTVLRRRHVSLVVALDDPEVGALAAAEPTDAASLYARVGATEVLEERRALLRRLRGAGARVVDEPADRLQPELVDRYLEIKMRGLV